VTVSADFNHEVQTVYEVLTDPDYLVDRNLALGELSSECEVEAFEDNATITAVREIERDLPAFLARLFNPVSVLDMTENWRLSDDRWSGDWTMRIRSQPVTIFGSFELVPTAEGCCYRVSHRAKANIPLIGGRVEAFVLEQTDQGAADELAYLGDYLERL
jgi:hypothetical protein